MDDRPTRSRNSGSRIWLIIGIVAALLFTCLVAGLVGGIAGYALGRSAGRAEAVPPPAERIVPAPERVPAPEMPGIPSGWALVAGVTADSPADRAGLRVGDLVVSVEGEALRDEVSLADVIRQYRPGDAVDLVVLREGRERTFTVTLGRNPADRNAPWLGIEYRQMPGR